MEPLSILVPAAGFVLLQCIGFSCIYGRLRRQITELEDALASAVRAQGQAAPQQPYVGGVSYVIPSAPPAPVAQYPPVGYYRPAVQV